MLAILFALSSLLAAHTAADLSASDVFDIDEGSCRPSYDLDSLYAQMVTLAESCYDDMTTILSTDGIDFDSAPETTANIAWNTRHAWGVADLEKAWKRDRDAAANRNGPRPPKRIKQTWSYPDEDVEKLKSAQGFLGDAVQKLDGTLGGQKTDLICSESAFKAVTSFAALVFDSFATVLTVLGACKCSMCTTFYRHKCVLTMNSVGTTMIYTKDFDDASKPRVVVNPAPHTELCPGKQESEYRMYARVVSPTTILLCDAFFQSNDLRADIADELAPGSSDFLVNYRYRAAALFHEIWHTIEPYQCTSPYRR